MAQEELVFKVKSDIKQATQDTKEFTKSLEDAKKAYKEINEQVDIQNKAINQLERELIELKAQQDSIPKGAWYAGMADLNKKIRETETNIRLEKNALKGLKEEQKGAAKNLKELNKEQKELEKTITDGIGNFKIFGVSINGMVKSVKKIVPLFRLMFSTIKRGLLSTGIGAFVVAFGSLIAYLTTVQEGMDKLNKFLAKVGAGFNVVKDRITGFGKIVGNIFNKKLSETLSDVKDNFSGITDEMERETKKAGELEEALQKLRDIEIEFIKTKSDRRKEIERLRLASEDETKAARQRLAFLKEAIALENKTLEEEKSNQAERVRIATEKAEMSNSTAADRRELANEIVKLNELETRSFRKQKRVQSEINTIMNEIQEKDLETIPRFQTEINDKLLQANQAYSDAILSNAKNTSDTQIELNKQVLGASSQFAGAVNRLAGENKQVSAAIALVNTYQAVSEVMKDATIPSTALKFITAGTVLANGLANVQRIFATNIPGASGGGSAPRTSLGGTPAPQMTSGQFTLGGDTTQPEPVQAYVVTDDMTNSQNKLANIRRRATI